MDYDNYQSIIIAVAGRLVWLAFEPAALKALPKHTDGDDMELLRVNMALIETIAIEKLTQRAVKADEQILITAEDVRF